MSDELKKATKKKIFEVAAELFSKYGYYKVSVREICEAAGVTKPVLYYYYKDKENLLCEMMKETRQVVDQIILRNLKPEQKFVVQLEGIIKFYIQFLNEYPHLMRFMTFVQLMSAPDEVKKFKYNKAKEDWEKLFRLFEQAQFKGELIVNVNHRILARNFLGTIIIIMSNFLMGHLTKSEYEKDLYDHLNFWKQQFTIDKK